MSNSHALVTYLKYKKVCHMFKKFIKTAIATSILTTISMVKADTIGFEVGAYQWNSDYSGTISVDDTTTSGTSLDIKDDLGFTSDSQSVLWIKIEHPLPILPNIKLVSSNLTTNAASVLTRDIVFGGETFTTNENVATQADLSNTEYTFYYELLDNWINLDAGVTIRQYDGSISLATDPTGSNINNSEVLDFVIPLLYLNGRFDLPMTGFFVEGQVNVISYNNDSISDTEFAIGYESDLGLGGKLGHRAFTMNVDEANFQSNLDFSGTYFSVFYHF